MKKETKKLDILRISGKKAENVKDIIVREYPITIVFNDVEIVTLLCSPNNLDYLAVGFLFAEGLINDKKEIKSLYSDDRKGVVWVETKKKNELAKDLLTRRFITTGCGKGISLVGILESGSDKRIKSGIKMKSTNILELMKTFQNKSRIHRLTGGVHSAAICNTEKILVFNEDIGRHSAIDKVIGECIMHDIEMTNHLVITSGRITSEILTKLARAKIPIVVSKSAPTDLGVKLAKDLGITLIGFARGSRMNVYSHSRRISDRQF